MIIEKSLSWPMTRMGDPSHDMGVEQAQDTGFGSAVEHKTKIPKQGANNMNRLYFHLMSVLNDTDNERGAAGVEYGIMVAAIAAVIVALAFTIGGQVQSAFQTVSTALGGGS